MQGKDVTATAEILDLRRPCRQTPDPRCGALRSQSTARRAAAGHSPLARRANRRLRRLRRRRRCGRRPAEAVGLCRRRSARGWNRSVGTRRTSARGTHSRAARAGRAEGRHETALITSFCWELCRLRGAPRSSRSQWPVSELRDLLSRPTRP